MRKRNGQFRKGAGVLSLSGRRFGRWSVTVPLVKRAKDRGVNWRCVCDCGTSRAVSGNSLRRGISQSCGCLTRELSSQRKKHGMSRSRVYHIWADMRNRCENPTHISFLDYGGRGIIVCRRWRSFPCFMADMGPRPLGATIERLNNAAGYSPKNCQWASRKCQQRNRRTNRILTIKGRSKCVAEWSEISGIRSATIFSRLHALKWTPEQAVFAPLKSSL